MIVCPNVGFPARLPSKIESRVTGWERDDGAVEEIGRIGDSSSSTELASPD